MFGRDSRIIEYFRLSALKLVSIRKNTQVGHHRRFRFGFCFLFGLRRFNNACTAVYIISIGIDFESDGVRLCHCRNYNCNNVVEKATNNEYKIFKRFSDFDDLNTKLKKKVWQSVNFRTIVFFRADFLATTGSIKRCLRCQRKRYLDLCRQK